MSNIAVTERQIAALRAQITALEIQADAEALAVTTAGWANGAYTLTNGRGAVVVKGRQTGANETSFVVNTTPPLRVRAEMECEHPFYESRVQAISDALLRCLRIEAGSRPQEAADEAPGSPLAKSLRAWAASCGTTKRAADVLGVPPRTVSGWVSGERRPSLWYAERIAGVTGLPLDVVEAGCVVRPGRARP